MIVIPAIDIRDEKVVRLFMGDFGNQTVYSQDPVEVARGWETDGATLLHIVDLDGAKAGRPMNLDIIQKISRAVRCRIQLGGGLRSIDDIKNGFGHGAWRVVLGTAACQNQALLGEVIEQFGERVAVAADVEGGEVVTNGWLKSGAENAVDFARRMQKIGASVLIYTDTVRDGTLEGVRIDVIQNFIKSVEIPVIVAGGVSSIEDIKKLLKLKPRPCGVIVGKALYEGKLNLKEAIELCSKHVN